MDIAQECLFQICVTASRRSGWNGASVARTRCSISGSSVSGMCFADNSFIQASVASPLHDKQVRVYKFSPVFKSPYLSSCGTTASLAEFFRSFSTARTFARLLQAVFLRTKATFGQHDIGKLDLIKKSCTIDRSSSISPFSSVFRSFCCVVCICKVLWTR